MVKTWKDKTLEIISKYDDTATEYILDGHPISQPKLNFINLHHDMKEAILKMCDLPPVFIQQAIDKKVMDSMEKLRALKEVIDAADKQKHNEKLRETARNMLYYTSGITGLNDWYRYTKTEEDLQNIMLLLHQELDRIAIDYANDNDMDYMPYV